MVANTVDDPYTARAKLVIAAAVSRLSREELFALAERIEKASKTALFDGFPMKPKQCFIDGCSQVAAVAGMCRQHYEREQRRRKLGLDNSLLDRISKDPYGPFVEGSPEIGGGKHG